jgi:serine/threonine-protein phosphatase PP1 catalytic subunit
LYGFFDECRERYSEKLWESFVRVFQYLPLAAVISERIFCVHGGLSPRLKKVAEIQKIRRPIAIRESVESMPMDLLWADPSNEHSGFAESDRGVSFTFGEDVVERFLEEHDYDLLCRGHQVVPAGYEFPFRSKKVLTVFSARDYAEEFGNDGAMLKVDDSLKCKFVVLPSRMKKKPIRGRPTTPIRGRGARA